MAEERAREELTLLNRLEELPRLHAWVDGLGDLDEKSGHRLRLICDELITNTIRYGYSDEDEHRIHLKLVCEEQSLSLAIEDDGKPFDPLAAAQPNTGLPAEERAIGGLGIHFVRSLADELSYERKNGRNRLTLRMSRNTE